jgi:hypothetical protein
MRDTKVIEMPVGAGGGRTRSAATPARAQVFDRSRLP